MKLKLIERFNGTRADDPGVWQVAVPTNQLAWINSSYLAPATDAQIAAAMPAPDPVETKETVTEVAESTEPTTKDALVDSAEDTTTSPADETVMVAETE
ncbi:MAG TPA: hypothetical protein DCX60_05200, partial [Phycisphaerales bacterium]|nr:hypothetical protein [Phycisphaerales bacterium]